MSRNDTKVYGAPALKRCFNGVAVDAPSDAHEDALLKIGKTLGVGTALVQGVVMEQPRPFDVGAAEAAPASQ